MSPRVPISLPVDLLQALQRNAASLDPITVQQEETAGSSTQYTRRISTTWQDAKLVQTVMFRSGVLDADDDHVEERFFDGQTLYSATGGRKPSVTKDAPQLTPVARYKSGLTAEPTRFGEIRVLRIGLDRSQVQFAPDESKPGTDIWDYTVPGQSRHYKVPA